MAIRNGRNYAIEIATPDQKTNPLANRGKLQMITESISLASTIADGDTVLGPLIPDGARIVDAKIVVKASTGGSGRFRLGTKAGFNRSGAVVAEDADSLVTEVDSGGQAAQASMAAGQAGLDVVAGKNGLRTFATCSEATDDLSGGPVELAWFVTVMMP